MTTQQNQAKVDERLRQAIIDKKRQQIEEWSDRISKLQARVQQSVANVRRESYRQLEDLIAARDAASARLEKLVDSTQETWSDVLQQTDSAFQALADRFHGFVNSHTT
ncbi:MAG: hypothetical protein VKI81_05650 [Synechococcaceae cyanobacterium]|nr:hypothetical protein [Synechococcaceae cyanobacterium]